LAGNVLRRGADLTAPPAIGPRSIDLFKFVAKGAKSHHRCTIKSLKYDSLGFRRLALPLRL
jgi:hypothetical protein